MRIYSDASDAYGLTLGFGFGNSTPSEAKFSWRNLHKIGDLLTNPSDALILLGREKTLYDYRLEKLESIRKSISEDVLVILPHWLYGAKWSWYRTWVNSVYDQSNLSLNFILPNRFQWLSSFELQTRIAVGVSRTLESISSDDDNITIQYPLHYLLNGKKVAGHLVQMNKESIRIGLGVNTDFAPSLPQNDELAQKLYMGSASFSFRKTDWIRLALEFLKNIRLQLAIESHDEYLVFARPTIWSYVRVYKDNHRITLGSPIDEWVLKTIDLNWYIVLENGAIYNPDHHMHIV